MALRILEIITNAGPHSDLTGEREADPTGKDRWDWAFIEVLTGADGQAGFEASTLQKAASTWAHWEAWHDSHAPQTLQTVADRQASCFRPTALHLRNYFKKTATRGPTAAAGDWQSFAWLRRHAGLVHLPLDTPLVAPFKHPKAGHQAVQQEPLRLEAFAALHQMLNDLTAPPWLRCAAALVARVLLSCLRWAHVERATAIPGESTERTQVWTISMGKGADRAGFKISVPTHLAPGVLLEPHMDVLYQRLAPSDRLHLVPDIHIGTQGLTGECESGVGRMSRTKFFNLAGHLLTPTHLQKVCGYTLRRWLPSVAGALQLPLERRRKDVVAGEKSRVSEPMSVRYSAQRLEATASVKRLCLGAVLHLLKWASAKNTTPTWAKLEGCIRSLPSIERHTGHPSWGTDKGAQEGEEESSDEVPQFADGSSSATAETTTSASSPSTSEDEEPQDLAPADLLQKATVMRVRWLAPCRSQLIHVARPFNLATKHAESTPLCRDAPFILGYDEGEGVAAAAILHREWCPRCLRRLPALPMDTYQQYDATGVKAADHEDQV